MIKKLFFLVTTVSAALTVLVSSATPPIAYSQGEMEVECGQILEGEFTNNKQEHIYQINMAPRESFNVSVEPIGDFLSTVVLLYGPSGINLGYTDPKPGGGAEVMQMPSIASGILSARGRYRIRVTNTAVYREDLVSDQLYYGGIGIYTLFIGCTDSDGNKIEPGDIAQPTPPPASLPTPTEQKSSQISLAQQPISETLFSFLETGQMYEITFGLQTETVKLIELRSDGWAKVEVDNRTDWLNINQVALIMPIN